MSAEHLAEAERLVNGDPDDQRAAIAHSLIAVAYVLRPATTTPRFADEFPMFTAAALLERMAIGDEGDSREITIAGLVVGKSEAFAQSIVMSAIQQTEEGTKERAEVFAAIQLLGIEFP